MSKKIIYFIVASLFAMTLLIPSVSLADSNGKGKKSLNNPGDVLVTDHVISTKLMDKTKNKATYETSISSSSSSLDPVDCSWTVRTDDSGQKIFSSGENLFKAQFSGDKIVVFDQSGKMNSWISSIYIDSQLITPPINPVIVNDFFKDSSYVNNCLLWDYGTVKENSALNEFFVLKNDSSSLKRYLRLSTGMVKEYWILDKDPQSKITLGIETFKESSAEGLDVPLVIYDSSDPISYISSTLIKMDKKSMYTIAQQDLKGKQYPVYIDPGLTFISSLSDVTLTSFNSDYSTTQNASLGVPIGASDFLKVGQTYDNLNYYVHRSFLYFDSSSIPDDATISSAYLQLYSISGVVSITPFYLVLSTSSSGTTYPHIPPAAADFDETNYTGTGGSLLLPSTITADTKYYITLNSTGLGWISKTGITKFALRSSLDISSSAPSNTPFQFFSFYSADSWSNGEPQNTDRKPQMIVTYSSPLSDAAVTTSAATNVSITSAVLNGFLTDDGRSDPAIPEDTSCSFQYGTSTGVYPYTSTTYDGYHSGESITIPVTGLSKGTKYYFRAKAVNPHATSYGSELTFLTLPDAPSLISVTPGDGSCSLSWTKGAGSTRTMIRYRTDAYPSSVSDGTEIYLNTGTSYTHSGLSSQRYYYSFWGEVTNGTQQFSSIYATNSGVPWSSGAPTITTDDATNVEVDSAVMNGYISSSNQDNSTVSLYFTWDVHTHVGGAYANTQAAYPSAINFNQNGNFYHAATGLSTNTEYFYRAKAVGTGGTSYGAEKTFTTGSYSSPSVVTDNASGLGMTSFTMNGHVSDDGDYTNGVNVSFEYGEDTSYGTSTPAFPSYGTGNSFTYTLNGMKLATTYHYRAVGTNASGTGKGVDKTALTLSPSSPTVATGSTPIVGSTVCTVSGSLTSDGGAPCETRFEYGLTDSYGSTTGWQAGKTTGNTFTFLLEGLTVGSTYHFRAVAKNATATVYGSDVTFTTAFDVPSDFSVKATSSTAVSLTWTPGGEKTLVRFQTAAYPTDREMGEQVYFGSDEETHYTGLVAGQTYYFSAWSWTSLGDEWTSDYAEDVVTMPAVTPGDENPDQEFSPTIEQDPSMYQSENNTRLQMLPFYSIINDAATDSGIPSTTVWFVVMMGVCLATAACASALFGGNAWIFVGTALVSMWAASLTTAIPWWVALLSTILGVLFILKFKGGGR